MATSQGMLAATRAKNPLEALEGVWLCQHLDFRLLDFGAGNKYISVVLSPPHGGNLREQPPETNAIARDITIQNL